MTPSRPRTAPRRPDFWSFPPVLAAVLILFAAALALYWGSLGHPLVFDDRNIRAGILSAWSEYGFRFARRWLSDATFAWLHEAGGGNWLWQRLANVLLHAATAAALFLFLDRLFELTLRGPQAAVRQPGLNTRWIALFGALVFLLHPAAVYGVAYLVQRSIVLATFLSLVSLRFFLEGLIRGSWWWHVAAAAAYFLAVFSKEHAVALPAVALALAVLVRGPSLRGLRELAAPFALFAIIGIAIVLMVKGFIGVPYEPAARALLDLPSAAHPGPEAPGAYVLSVINQGALYFRYLLTWLVPYTGWMSVDVRTPFPTGLLDGPQAVGFTAWLAYPVCAAALLATGGRAGLIGFSLLYPWLFALTEVATVRVQEPFVLYRSYLWMSGLPVVLGAAFLRVRARWSAVIFSAMCLALIPPLLGRLDTFSGRIKLWDDVVRGNAGVQAALVERGYHNRGLAYLDAKQYPDALRDFDRALDINPRDVSALVGRGTLFARTGSFDRALTDLGRAIEVDPSYAEAHAKRCFAKMMIEEPRNALPDCEKAVALNPRHRDAHTNLGVVYAALNRTGAAEASYRRALDIDPSNADANYNYGVLLAVLRRRDAARVFLGRACDARMSDACNLLAALTGQRRPR